MRRLFLVWLLSDRQTLDALPGFLQLALAQLQVVAPEGDRGDRVLQAELAFRQRLLIGQRFVEAHGTASSTVASSRPAESSTLTDCPLRACSAPRMMPPPPASRVML